MSPVHSLCLILLVLVLKNLLKARSQTHEQSEIFKIECSNKDKCLKERTGTVKLSQLGDKAEEHLRQKSVSQTQLLKHLKKE